MDIKQQIITTLIRSDGNVNASLIHRQRYLDSELHQQILNSTQFLTDVPYAQRVYCILNDIAEPPLCCACKSLATFLPSKGAGYSKTCSSQKCKTSASSDKRIETMIRTYGAKVSDKTRRSASDRANQLQIKGRATLKTKYGVVNPSQMTSHKAKVLATVQERYGVDRIFDIPARHDQIHLRRLEAFKVLLEPKVIVTNVVKRTNDTRQLFIVSYTCPTCKIDGEILGETAKWRSQKEISACTKCSGLVPGVSLAQLNLYEFVQQLSPDAELCNRSMLDGRRELDIVDHRSKLAIEYDGLYWHSYGSRETAAEKRTHLLKTEQCEEQGYRLIHVFEHEWINSCDIVKSRIRSHLGLGNKIYARKCTVAEVPKDQAKLFMEHNHIQGSVGCKVAIGLYHDGQLVACMTFGTPRYGKYDWELLRLSSSLNTTVIGGASKLLKHFVRLHNPISIVSYADRRWSTTAPVYLQLGFSEISRGQPNYFYFKSQEGIKLLSRVMFQKHKLHNKLDIFDPEKSESENMFANGYRRIWDCGSVTYLWTANHRQ